MGSVVRLPERQLDAVTGVSGSGPAYVFLMAEALIDAGVTAGLSREISQQLVVGTVLGSARMMAETGEDPGALRAAVTSPGGTTAAAVRTLEFKAVRSAFIEAVAAATERSRQLGRSSAGWWGRCSRRARALPGALALALVCATLAGCASSATSSSTTKPAVTTTTSAEQAALQAKLLTLSDFPKGWTQDTAADAASTAGTPACLADVVDAHGAAARVHAVFVGPSSGGQAALQPWPRSPTGTVTGTVAGLKNMSSSATGPRTPRVSRSPTSSHAPSTISRPGRPDSPP